MIAKAHITHRALATLAAAALLSGCTAENPSGESERPGTDAALEAEIALDESSEQAAPVDSAIPAHFRAIGTEPFWAVTNGSAGLRYMTPDNSEGVAVTVTDEIAQAQLRGVSGTLDDESFAIEITLATCSDGMSDRVYPFTATLKFGGEVRNGCARPMDS